jgi:hypothetical protein
MRTTFFVVLAAIALLTGCDHDAYKIKMTAKDGRLERTVTVTHVTRGGTATVTPASGPAETDGATSQPAADLTESRPAAQPSKGQVNPEVLARLAKLYPERPAEDTFRGVYAKRLPPGTGEGEGAGQYSQLVTSMGTLSAYVERFRGNDDQAAVLEAQFKAIDRLTDLLLGWATAEWGTRKEFPKIKAFIDHDLRKDLKNVQVFLWMQNVSTRRMFTDGESKGEPQTAEIIARASQYFVEREYLTEEEVPRLLSLFEEGEEGRLDAWTLLLRGLLVRKVGLADKAFVEEIASLLKRPEGARASLEKYLRTTSEWKEAEAEREKTKATRPATSEPATEESVAVTIFGNLLEKAFYSDMDSTDSFDEVEVPELPGARGDERPVGREGRGRRLELPDIGKAPDGPGDLLCHLGQAQGRVPVGTLRQDSPGGKRPGRVLPLEKRPGRGRGQTVGCLYRRPEAGEGP